jgi:hypothetical protein
MINYPAYRFNELDENIQKKVYERELAELVRYRMDTISEKEYQRMVNTYGEYYLESTTGFLEQCYYDEFEKDIHSEYKTFLEKALFRKDGYYIDNVEVE